jgi:hypothetical protein
MFTVDDVGFDAEASGGVGDAELGVAAGLGVDVAVLVGPSLSTLGESPILT